MKKVYLIIILIVLIIKFFILDIYIVEGISMYPTLKSNEIVLVNKVYNELKVNDIVILKINGSKYVKRILASKGNEIVYNNDIFTINDMKIPKGSYFDNQYNEVNRVLLKEDEFFVIGDNVNESIDSRLFGIVNKDMVIGKVIIN